MNYRTDLNRGKVVEIFEVCMVINLAPPENFSGVNDVISMPCASDARASLGLLFSQAMMLTC